MSHHGLHTLKGTERFLVTRRIVPYGEANLFDELPVQIRDTISEVHYVDGSDPTHKGLQGTYGVDLPADLAAKFERATNLVDLTNISEHGMGWHPEPDLQELIEESPLSAALDERFGSQWGPDQPKRWRTGPTLDQGREGACVGFANTAFLNAEPIMTTFDNAYARGVYKRAQQIDPWPGEDYEGTSVQAGMEVLRERGLVLTPGWTKGWDEFVSWLSNVGPLVLGMDWFEGMHRPDANGFIHPTGRLTGGHAILCPERGVGKVRLKNSWGDPWGMGGDCFLSDDALRALMGRQHFIAGALVQVGEIKPEPPKDEYQEMWVSDFCNSSVQPYRGKKIRLKSRLGFGWNCNPTA